MNFLAQTLPTENPGLVIMVVNVIVILIMMVVGILVGLKKLREPAPVSPTPPPQPFVTKRHDDFVPRHEFNRLETQVNNMGKRIEDVKDDLLRAGEERAVKLHERLTSLVEPLREIQGRTEVLTAALLDRDKATGTMKRRQS